MRLLRHLACPVRPCATVVTRPVGCQGGREPDSGHSDCVRRDSGRPDSVQSAFVSIRGGRWSFCPYLPRRPGERQKRTPYVGDMAVWSGQSLKLSVLVGRFNRWPAFPEPDKWNRWVCRGVCRSPRGASLRPGHGEGVDHAREPRANSKIKMWGQKPTRDARQPIAPLLAGPGFSRGRSTLGSFPMVSLEHSGSWTLTWRRSCSCRR